MNQITQAYRLFGPRWLCSTNISQDFYDAVFEMEMEEYHEERRHLQRGDDLYRKNLREWKKTDDYRQARIEYLNDAIEETEDQLITYYKIYAQQESRQFRLQMARQYDSSFTKKRLEKLKSERYYLTADEVSDDFKKAVEIARDVPISDITGPGPYVECPYGDHRRKKMWIKGGFGYCFACSRPADTIAYVMAKEGVDFKKAVSMLTGGLI